MDAYGESRHGGDLRQAQWSEINCVRTAKDWTSWLSAQHHDSCRVRDVAVFLQCSVVPLSPAAALFTNLPCLQVVNPPSYPHQSSSCYSETVPTQRLSIQLPLQQVDSKLSQPLAMSCLGLFNNLWLWNSSSGVPYETHHINLRSHWFKYWKCGIQRGTSEVK